MQEVSSSVISKLLSNKARGAALLLLESSIECHGSVASLTRVYIPKMSRFLRYDPFYHLPATFYRENAAQISRFSSAHPVLFVENVAIGKFDQCAFLRRTVFDWLINHIDAGRCRIYPELRRIFGHFLTRAKIPQINCARRRMLWGARINIVFCWPE